MSRHHEHEISEHPEIQWALDLLKPDPNYEPSISQKYGWDIVGVTVGLSTAYCKNLLLKRPIHSGLQYHIIAITAGYLAAQVIKKYMDQYYTEGDSRLRDYIIRHPELFPEPPRVKYGEILEPWCPIR